jgi:hypothetical protein
MCITGPADQQQGVVKLMKIKKKIDLKKGWGIAYKAIKVKKADISASETLRHHANVLPFPWQGVFQ